MTLSVTNLGIEGLTDVEQIGTGGSSRVYRARQVDLDRVVAVKVLNPGGDQGVARRFDRERKAMGRLSLHEGIVPVYSSGVTTHGEPYLVMPYYPNGSLQDQIDTGPLEWETAVSYVDVAAETIAAAHEEGIVHLDLKPANILLTNTGAPRIADFGIARLTGAAAAGTTAGTAFTPAYSAPETFLDGETGPPSDVYGLGATLWALLVGHPPFLTPGDDSNLMAVIGRVVNNQVGDLRHIAPAEICAVIERAMAKRPEDRYQTASEFSLALKQAAAGVSPDFAPPMQADQGTALFPSPATTQTPAGPVGPVGAPVPSADTTLHHTESPSPGRPLLQETAQPLAKPVNQPPAVAPTPFIDLDRFRIAPLVIAAIAFVAVVGVAAFALFGGGDTTSADGDGTQIEADNPAGPTTEATTASSIEVDTGSATTGATDSDDATDDDASSSTETTTASSTSASTTETTTPDSSSSTTSEGSTTSEASTSSTTETTTSTSSTTETTTSTSSSSSSSSSTSSTTSTTIADPIQPPGSLSATAGADDTSVSLGWTAPASGPDPDGYRLTRNGTLLRELAGSRTTFTDRNLAPGTYTYTVRSLDDDGDASSGTSATVTVGPLELTAFNVTRTVGERISASFSANKCVTSYTISAVPTGGGDGETVSSTGPASGCVDSDSVILGGLVPTTDYQVNVRVRLDGEVASDFAAAPAPDPEP
ncbi:MAG: protein kinase [Actinomycetota bacterium]